MSRSGSMPTKPVPAPRRGREPSQVLQIIVECAAVVSKDSLSNFKSGWISPESMFVAPTIYKKVKHYQSWPTF